ncbi:polysaccharide ABC transporter ATP-binding protein [Flavobacterium macrobrachii]|uniref:ATP-binding cassette domain-containing protein n=1 Tax=Flavobacterium macrobrachii TaxID=591204 RepID=A0ABS2CY25_9FLAO|nr:ABC transporter ATP-binding protein [Flavobacterium macrobrachii]MBM6499848.1 ATP-binding cassette domain-containing protein [Flavobacterium macrobrachii]
MSKTVIELNNISKAYQIGQIGTGTLSRDIERFWLTKVLGKEDPFLKIGETNDRTSKGNTDIVWSLKDINFKINEGEAVGIIGRNGAGKSTLLKLLSRVTGPTTGEIKVKGRIASLLEVGTGFHPELTGRENIFLNGAILGMRKKEIARKLDEIIDFSGVERYIDTPVKRYSSGMYVRLAFAVAAHLESEILIVDEVLAVGDAEFQKKCLGKMGDISKGQGRTVLFVSHNMAAVQSLCNHGIVLVNGSVSFDGEISNAINHYLQQGNASSTISDKLITIGNDSFIVNYKLLDEEFQERTSFRSNSNIVVDLLIKSENTVDFKNYVFELKIIDIFGNIISVISSYLSGFILNKKTNELILRINIGPINFMKGDYKINLVVVNYNDTSKVKTIENFMSLEIIDALKLNINRDINPRLHGNIAFNTSWEII